MNPLLAPFAGSWTLIRRIEDRRGGGVMHVAGTLMLQEAEDGLLAVETGILVAPDGSRLHAERRNLWRAEGDRIAVLFEDGRPFHNFRPGPAQEVRHDCAPDLYRGRYVFDLPVSWSVTWTVTGPRKDYTSVTRLAR